MATRDEFRKSVKNKLAARAGYHCSNPSCRALTVGPEALGNGTVNMGVAAHVAGASPGGARYDAEMTKDDRASVDNGIWLCPRCAQLIDKKEHDYSVGVLQSWKMHAEQAARDGLETPDRFAGGSANTFVVASVFRFRQPSRYFEISRWPAPVGKRYCQPVHISRLHSTDRVAEDQFIPLVLDASFGRSGGACAFMLQLENKGTSVEPHSSIELRLDGPVLFEQKSNPSQRVVEVSQIKEDARSSVGGISVSNLAPGETVCSQINSEESGPFDAVWYCTQFSHSQRPNVFDVDFGEPELCDLPARDSGFIEKQFPFR